MSLNTESHHIEDLIANYLAGEATPDEVALVERWRKESESNRRYFDHLKLIFEKAATIPVSETFNADRAWSKLRSKLPEKGRVKTIPLTSDALGYKVILRIAAGITIFLAVGFFAYNFFRTDSVPKMELLADKNIEADTLPEGSEVFLNRKTRIEYSFDRSKNSHTAKVVGEAYFNISHHDDKTFIVQADETFIKDIGTSFNVKAYPGAATIEVVVEEGEVVFYTQGNPGIYLKTNGKGVYDKTTKTFTIAEPEPNVAAYKTRFFSFSNHSLESIVKMLNEVYSTKIEIAENLKACRLTVSFNDESIDEIASIIAETLGLTVSKSGNVITLKGTACPAPQP
ncbi:MAG: FecR domain-containing protein [Cyclobacteriaceae bacterium]